MLFRATTLAAVSPLLASVANADFQIYTSSSITGTPDGEYHSASGFFILPGPPSCDDICGHAIYQHAADDVSGGRSGIRCKGCATDGPIQEFEFHDPDESGAHWTLYNPEYKMVPADGGPFDGDCYPDNGDNFENCSCGLGNAEDGHRLFICKSHYTAQEMGTFK